MNRGIEICSCLDEAVETNKGTEEVAVPLKIVTFYDITPENPVREDEECEDAFAYLCKLAEKEYRYKIKDQRVDENVVLRPYFPNLVIIAEDENTCYDTLKESQPDASAPVKCCVPFYLGFNKIASYS
jgi:hypothetical protein